jgi:hypothetical protein
MLISMRNRASSIYVVGPLFFGCTSLLASLGFATGAWSQTVPQSGFYIGAGGGFSSTDVGHQDVYAVGTSDVLNPSGRVIQTGRADGPPVPVSMNTRSNLAPSAQAGYFRHFSNSNWLWGAKASYSRPNSTSTTRNALIPQFGSFTTVPAGASTAFTGNALIISAQTTLVQQMGLTPFIGRSFDRSMVYFGAGPTRSQLRTHENGVIGFADLNGTRTDVSGAPQNFSSVNWTYGAAATVGGAYFLDKSWMLDVSYTYAQTKRQTGNFSGTFSNPNGAGGNTLAGTLVGTSTWRAKNQTISATINWLF